jgi:radical SAM superfamily enzyme YgiQ (UPF0313 family)
MKVLFVYSNSLGLPYYHFGIGILSSVVKKENHKVKLLDLTFNSSIKRSMQVLKSFNPDVIGFSSNSSEFENVKNLAKIFKRKSNAFIICGGIHPTTSPEEVISNSCFDAICIGESELAFAELLRKKEKKEDFYNTKNFWFRKGKKIIKNELRPLIKNLNKLPFFDREVFDYKKYLFIRDGEADFKLSRGCYFKCSFCSNEYLQRLYKKFKQPFVRFRSVEWIIEEINLVKKKYKLKHIIFNDELFNFNKRYLRKFCELYKKKINLPFECDIRADLCDEEMFKLLREAGCTDVNIGVESGNSKIRKKILNKTVTEKQILNAFKLAKKYHIQTTSLNMIGLPFETRENIKDTINLNKKISSDRMQVARFNAFKGTKLYKLCQDNEMINEKTKIHSKYLDTNVKHNYLSEKELKSIRRKFSYYCYKDKSLILAIALLIKEYLMQIYLKYNHFIPKILIRLMYKSWHKKIFKFY